MSVTCVRVETDGDVLEACCCFVSAEWLHCAPVRVCQNAQTLGHESPDRVGAPLQMCELVLTWVSLRAPVEARELAA